MRFLLLLALVSCATNTVLTEKTDKEAGGGVKFTTSSQLAWVNDLVKTANCVSNNQKYIDEVKAHKQFDYTDKTSSEVAELLGSDKIAKVSTYRTKNPVSKAIATTFAGDKDTVYLNTRRNPRDMKDMVNTLFHERFHLLGFSHGDNSPVGKENSVNYGAGAMAEKYVEECK